MQLRRTPKSGPMETLGSLAQPHTIDPTKPMSPLDVQLITLFLGHTKANTTLAAGNTVILLDHSTIANIYRLQFTHTISVTEELVKESKGTYVKAQIIHVDAPYDLAEVLQSFGFGHLMDAVKNDMICSARVARIYLIDGVLTYQSITSNQRKIEFTAPINPMQFKSRELNAFFQQLTLMDYRKNIRTAYQAGVNVVTFTNSKLTVSFVFILGVELIYAPSDSKPGSHNYNVMAQDDVINKGGSATVYDVICTLRSRNGIFEITDHHRVIKASDLQRYVKRPGTDFVECVRHEYELSKRLPHLHAKQPTFFGHACYIPMQRLRGRELFELLENEALSADEYLELFRTFIEALRDTVHENRIIHKDIKQENAFVERIGCAKFRIYIYDVGLGKDMQENDFGSTAGTAGFMAPEILPPLPSEISKITNSTDIYSQRYLAAMKQLGVAQSSIASDIYTTGIMFAEMLGSGVPGLTATFNTEEALLQLHKNTLHPPLANLFVGTTGFTNAEKEALKSMIQWMTHADRTLRPSHNDVIAILEDIILARFLRKAKTSSEYVDLKLAQALAIKTRDDLKQRFRDLHKNPAAVKGLSKPILGRLNGISDTPRIINLFTDTLRIRAFYSCHTKADVIATMNQIVDAAAQAIKNIDRLISEFGKHYDVQNNIYCKSAFNYLTNRAQIYLERYTNSFDDLITLATKLDKLQHRTRLHMYEIVTTPNEKPAFTHSAYSL